MEATKDTNIGGRRYRMGRVSASVGSWLCMRMLDCVMAKAAAELSTAPPQPAPAEPDVDAPKKPEPDPEVMASVYVQAMMMGLSESDLARVQTHALSVCSRYEAPAEGQVEIPFPVLMQNGAYALPDLATDFVTVTALTSQALIFNLSPFFAAGTPRMTA